MFDEMLFGAESDASKEAVKLWPGTGEGMRQHNLAGIGVIRVLAQQNNESGKTQSWWELHPKGEFSYRITADHARKLLEGAVDNENA